MDEQEQLERRVKEARKAMFWNLGKAIASVAGVAILGYLSFRNGGGDPPASRSKGGPVGLEDSGSGIGGDRPGANKAGAGGKQWNWDAWPFD